VKVFLFRVGLAILKLVEPVLLKLDFDECLVVLKNTTGLSVSEVIEQADKFSMVDAKLMKKLKMKAVKVLKSAPLADLM
jgi:hypothetical protein